MVKSKLVPAILVGAAVGAVVSMFDKNTRDHTVQTASKVKETVSYYAQNREELQSLLETKVHQAQSFFNSAEQNIQAFLGSDEQGQSLPETITSLLTETKEAFSKKEQ
ncbi:MAG: YtxH domain-containing protein [Lysinibacillus sp.]